MTKSKISAAFFAALALSPTALFANDAVWLGSPVSSNWSNPANWLGAAVPSAGNTTTISFGNSSFANPNQDIASPFSLNTLTFASNASPYTLTGGALTFAGNAAIHQNANSAPLIGEALSIQSNLTIDGAGDLFLTGPIDSANGTFSNRTLTKSGNGALSLAAVNPFAGTLAILAGSVDLKEPAALQHAIVSLQANGTLNLLNNPSVTLAGLQGNGSLSVGPTNLTLALAGAAPVYTGALSASKGSLAISGNGTQTFSAAQLTPNSLSINSAAVDINGGALTLPQTNGISLAGNASFTVEGAAHVNLAADGFLNIDAGSLVAQGNGTLFSGGGQIVVGVTGSASFLLQQNAAISGLTGLFAGTHAGASGNITFASGAAVADSKAFIGYQNGALGSVTVDGPGTSWSNVDILLGGTSLGATGTGALHISNGANVSVTDATYFWSANSSISISNATFTTSYLTTSGAAVGSISLTDPAGQSALVVGHDLGTSTYAGNISGTGSITKVGSSSQFLLGNNSFTGNVTVLAGSLDMASGASSFYHAAGGSLTLRFGLLGNATFQADPGTSINYQSPALSGGIFTGAGIHDLSNVTACYATTFTADAQVTLPANITFYGVTNAATLLLNNASWIGGANAGDVTFSGISHFSGVTSTGNLTLASGSTLISTSSPIFLTGSCILLQPATVYTLSGASLELDGGSLTNNASLINGLLNINYGAVAAGAGHYATVNVAPGGLFEPGDPASPSPSNASVNQLTGSGTIDTPSPTSNFTLSLHGNTTSAFSGTIRNTTGAVALSLSDNANLTLSGAANSYAGPTSIDATSTLQITAPGALSPNSPIANDGNLYLFSNATAKSITGRGFLYVDHELSLTLAPGHLVNEQAFLNLSYFARLDLSDNSLVLQYSGDPSTRSGYIVQLQTWVKIARNGGAWNNDGITSTTAAADPTHLSLAVADNNLLHLSSFGNVTLDDNSILITPALLGDANLDNKVDLTDLSTVLNHFGQSTPNWTDGHFDSAQTINLTDLSYVLNNFGLTFAGNSSQLPITNDQLPSAPTPEPTSLAAALPALLLLTRRPQNRNSRSPRARKNFPTLAR
ncbi:MAG: autotransporter-associated beta strand repeat-containing protein [Phycisphaerae bacterium]